MKGQEQDKEYNQLLDDLQRVSRGEDRQSYIALPLSDVSAKNREGKDLIIPSIIPNTFHFIGNLLKCKRELGQIEGRVPHSTLHGTFTCPECTSSLTEQIKFSSIEAHHCVKCGLVWQSYPCWCMSCGGYLWSETYESDTVHCDKCHTKWDVEVVKSAHLSGDIFLEDI